MIYCRKNGDKDMKLYRPVGLYEMSKILDLKGEEFPKEFFNHSLCRVIVNLDYALKVARDWNAKDRNSGYAGFVIEFEVNKSFIDNYTVQCVGKNNGLEYLIPANQISIFNYNIKGKIKIQDAFFGDDYIGINPLAVTGFKEKSPLKQIELLERIRNYNSLDFSGTIYVEWKIMNLNLLYWKKQKNKNEELLENIEKLLLLNKRYYYLK